MPCHAHLPGTRPSCPLPRRIFLQGVLWPCYTVSLLWPLYWGHRSPGRYVSVPDPKRKLPVLEALALPEVAVLVEQAVPQRWPVAPEAPEGPVVELTAPGVVVAPGTYSLVLLAPVERVGRE